MDTTDIAEIVANTETIDYKKAVVPLALLTAAATGAYFFTKSRKKRAAKLEIVKSDTTE